MAHYRNIDWKLPDLRIETWEQVSVSVLMDIREELRTLNRLLNCPKFTSIPRKLDAISRNTAKKKPARKKATP